MGGAGGGGASDKMGLEGKGTDLSWHFLTFFLPSPFWRPFLTFTEFTGTSSNMFTRDFKYRQNSASPKASHKRVFTLIGWQPGSANTGFSSILAISSCAFSGSLARTPFCAIPWCSPTNQQHTKAYQNRWVSKWQDLVLGTFKTRNFGAPAILVHIWAVLWHPKGYQNRWFSESHVLGIFKTSQFDAPAILVHVWAFPNKPGSSKWRFAALRFVHSQDIREIRDPNAFKTKAQMHLSQNCPFSDLTNLHL